MQTKVRANMKRVPTSKRQFFPKLALVALHLLVTLIADACITATALADSPRSQVQRPNVIVFFTDGHGHADLSCQDVVPDIRTPHVDAVAASGVRARHGYSTAPQCVPSRGGLLIWKFQSRFGLDSNASSLDGFNRETTIAQLRGSLKRAF